MRLTLGALSAALLAACGHPPATSGLNDLSDVVSMTQRADGGFDVTCRDGRSEIHTQADVTAGRLCLRQQDPTPTWPDDFSALRCDGEILREGDALPLFPPGGLNTWLGTYKGFAISRTCNRTTGCSAWAKSSFAYRDEGFSYLRVKDGREIVVDFYATQGRQADADATSWCTTTANGGRCGLPGEIDLTTAPVSTQLTRSCLLVRGSHVETIDGDGDAPRHWVEKEYAVRATHSLERPTHAIVLAQGATAHCHYRPRYTTRLVEAKPTGFNEYTFRLDDGYGLGEEFPVSFGAARRYDALDTTGSYKARFELSAQGVYFAASPFLGDCEAFIPMAGETP